MSPFRRSSIAPEMALRRAPHGRGLRSRVKARMPGSRRRRVDITFTQAKVAVLVGGCCQHGYLEQATQPKTKREWWDWNIARKQEGDADTNPILANHGWRVVRVWEHEDPDQSAERIVELLRP
nr:very short patch repair endonuclease [Aeromicrobium stalagmiti]